MYRQTWAVAVRLRLVGEFALDGGPVASVPDVAFLAEQLEADDPGVGSEPDQQLFPARLDTRAAAPWAIGLCGFQPDFGDGPQCETVRIASAGRIHDEIRSFEPAGHAHDTHESDGDVLRREGKVADHLYAFLSYRVAGDPGLLKEGEIQPGRTGGDLHVPGGKGQQEVEVLAPSPGAGIPGKDL